MNTYTTVITAQLTYNLFESTRSIKSNTSNSYDIPLD